MNMSADGGYELGQTVKSSPVTEFCDTAKCNKRLKLCYSRDGANDEHSELFVPNNTYIRKCTTLSTMPSAKELNCLVHLSKKYLEYFEVPKIRTGKRLHTYVATSINPDPVAHVWLLEPDWHDRAYKELLLVRNMHSSLLDKAYMDRLGDCFTSTNAVEAHSKYLKKLVNFLGQSRDGIGALSKEECYDCMMDIKCVVDYHTKQDSDDLQHPVSNVFAGKTRFHNWRDHIYEQLISLRNRYSYKLDDAYKYVHEGHTQSNILTRYKEQCLEFLEESLDFIGNSRADIVFLSEKKCCKRLMTIEDFLEGRNYLMRRLYMVLCNSASFSGCENQEENSLPNWRDLAYEEIQSMKDGFLLKDYIRGFSVCCKEPIYIRGFTVWSEIPELHESLEELAECAESVQEFFSVSRHAMALLSKDEHARSVKECTRVLEKVEDLVSHLQKECRKYCIPNLISSSAAVAWVRSRRES